jgi:hypothetical protein
MQPLKLITQSTRRKEMIKKVLVLATCMVFLMAGAVQAETVTYFGVSPGETIGIVAPTIPYSGGAYAGMYNFAISDGSGLYTGSYKGYCVEPAIASSSFTATIIAVTEGSRYEAAAYLLGKYYDTTSTIANKAAQVQMAVWELVWDFGGTYNLANGTFQTSTYTSEVNALITEAVAALPGFTPSGYYVAQAPAGAFGSAPQDFIFKTPEPGVLTLLGLGLVALGITRRRTK